MRKLSLPAIAIASASLLGGCGLPIPGVRSIHVETLARGYQPIDPEPAELRWKGNRPGTNGDNPEYETQVRDALTNTVTRIAVGRLDTSGSINFGPVEAAQKGDSYVVVVDRILCTSTSIGIEYLLADLQTTERLASYITINNLFDPTPLPTDVTLQMMYDDEAGEYFGIYTKLGGDRLAVFVSFAQSEKDFVALSDSVGEAAAAQLFAKINKNLDDPIEHKPITGGRDDRRFFVPVYIRVGVRMRFEVEVLGNSVNLSEFTTFGAQASRNQIRGTVTLQTLGLSGPDVADRLPVPLEISESSIPAVMQTLASIFSKIYDNNEDGGVHVRPQVIGFESPPVLPGGASFLESAVRSRVHVMDCDESDVQLSAEGRKPADESGSMVPTGAGFP